VNTTVQSRGASADQVQSAGTFLVSTGPQALALVVFALLAAASIWTAHESQWLPPLLSEFLSNDDIGIILAQLSGFVAFVLLCGAQIAVSVCERKTLLEKRTVGAWYLRAAGLGADWAKELSATEQLRLTGNEAEIVLGQHENARLSLLRILLGAFPAAGFIGTVLGIRLAIQPLDALAKAGGSQAEISSALGDVVSGLELAFDTTLVGLILLLFGSFILGAVSVLMHSVHAKVLVKWQD
jgi:hypothetical protein